MIAILSTHPIQYQVPIWQELARRGEVPFEVWYLCDHGVKATLDREFGERFAWDLPLLSGYPHRFLEINEDWVMDLRKPNRLRLKHSLAPLLLQTGAKTLWLNGWHKRAIWQAARDASRIGVPLWLRAESNDLSRTVWWKRPVRTAMLRWLFGRVSRFLCIGAANRRLYLHHDVPEGKLAWAPYCVDNQRFSSRAAELRPHRQALRERWGISKDAFCVLFCGKLIAKKRPTDVVAAVTQLENRGARGASVMERPIHLLFAGTGELKPQLAQMCTVRHDAVSDIRSGEDSRPAGPNRGPAASFTGFLNQSEIAAAYVAADCLVLPSDSGETWGLVVNEAMASGLPCIVSDRVGCAEDLVTPVDPGLVFEMGNVANLAMAISRCMKNAPAPSRLREVVSDYRIEKTVDTVHHLAGLGPPT